jgi:excisionase family DNA binding protein
VINGVLLSKSKLNKEERGMALADSARLGGGSLATWGAGVLFILLDPLGGGLYEGLRTGVEEAATNASYILQAVVLPHLRSLKQGLQRLRQSLEEFNHTLLEVEEALESQAETEAQREERSSPDKAKGVAAILSMKEVCRELGMSKSWVYNRVRSGQIPSIKLGGAIKIKRADLDEYIEKLPYQSFDKD